MLVASCNNAAVENITKELPDGTALLKGMEPGKKEEESVRRGLLEVQALFRMDEADRETYTAWNQQLGRYESQSYPDIYFTKLANDLAKRKEGEWDRWGLISAPFGKMSNLKEYMAAVLKPYIGSFGSNDSIGRHKAGYTAAVERFQKQLEKYNGWNKNSSRSVAPENAFRAESIAAQPSPKSRGAAGPTGADSGTDIKRTAEFGPAVEAGGADAKGLSSGAGWHTTSSSTAG